MPPRGPRPPSVQYGRPRQFTAQLSDNRDSTLSSTASELTIIGDDLLGEKSSFGKDIKSSESPMQKNGYASNSDEDVISTEDGRSRFRPPIVQAPTAFRTTYLHKRDDSASTLAVYLPENYNCEKEFVHARARVMAEETPKRETKFWLCIAALMTSSFLIVLDLVCFDSYNAYLEARANTWILQTGLSTALPTIVNDLHGTEFEWVGSAYALASTAFLPLTGALAQVCPHARQLRHYARILMRNLRPSGGKYCSSYSFSCSHSAVCSAALRQICHS